MLLDDFTTNEGFCSNQGLVTYGPAAITGCAGFWDFNNLASLTFNTGRISQVKDMSGAGHNLKQTGASSSCPSNTTSGGFNNRGFAGFNGTSTFMWTDPFNITSSSKFSIAARVLGAAQVNKMIAAFTVAQSEGASFDYYFATGNDNSTKLRGLVNNGTDSSVQESSDTAFDSSWRSVAFTFNNSGGGSLSVFVDGGTATTATGNVSLGAGNGTGVMVGARQLSSTSNLFAGNMEYVAIYRDYILTATDLTNLVNYGV